MLVLSSNLADPTGVEGEFSQGALDWRGKLALLIAGRGLEPS